MMSGSMGSEVSFLSKSIQCLEDLVSEFIQYLEDMGSEFIFFLEDYIYLQCWMSSLL